MKAPLRRLASAVLCCLVAGAATALAAPGRPAKASATTGAVNFARTKQRIDALLAPRLKPEPLPELFPSPFQLPESSAPRAAIPTKSSERLIPASDSEMLLYYGAGLKISGTVETNGQVHLVINQAPYKVGDTLTLKTKDDTAKLRIIAIAPGELTLGLNEAVQVIKFQK